MKGRDDFMFVVCSDEEDRSQTAAATAAAGTGADGRGQEGAEQRGAPE